MGAKESKRLRDLAAGLGMSLAEEGKLNVGSRKAMFEMEVRRKLIRLRELAPALRDHSQLSVAFEDQTDKKPRYPFIFRYIP